MYMKNEQEAYDTTQETFLKMMQKNKSFTNEEHEKAWLIVTATNCCKDALKSFWRKHKTELDHAPLAGK